MMKHMKANSSQTKKMLKRSKSFIQKTIIFLDKFFRTNSTKLQINDLSGFLDFNVYDHNMIVQFLFWIDDLLLI